MQLEKNCSLCIACWGRHWPIFFCLLKVQFLISEERVLVQSIFPRYLHVSTFRMPSMNTMNYTSRCIRQTLWKPVNKIRVRTYALRIDELIILYEKSVNFIIQVQYCKAKVSSCARNNVNWALTYGDYNFSWRVTMLSNFERATIFSSKDMSF